MIVLQVEGIGEIVAESVLAWFADSDNQKMLEKFISVGVKPHFKSLARGPLHGKSFVVTGTLMTLSRDEAADRVRSLGGVFQSSVGKDTSYLVVGQNVGESKLAKAKKLGTKQLSEAEFVQLLHDAA